MGKERKKSAGQISGGRNLTGLLKGEWFSGFKPQNVRIKKSNGKEVWTRYLEIYDLTFRGLPRPKKNENGKPFQSSRHSLALAIFDLDDNGEPKRSSRALFDEVKIHLQTQLLKAIKSPSLRRMLGAPEKSSALQPVSSDHKPKVVFGIILPPASINIAETLGV